MDSLVIAGSRSRNLHLEDSDLDIFGFYVPTLRDLVSYREPKEHRNPNFAVTGSYTKVEGTVYDIRKFFRMVEKGASNTTTILFPEATSILQDTPEFQLVRHYAREMVSKTMLSKLRSQSVALLKTFHEEGDTKALYQATYHAWLRSEFCSGNYDIAPKGKTRERILEIRKSDIDTAPQWCEELLAVSAPESLRELPDPKLFDNLCLQMVK
jgi:predicted nucleotidyltransferase